MEIKIRQLTKKVVGKFENIIDGRFKKIYLEMNKWKLKNIKEKMKK